MDRRTEPAINSKAQAHRFRVETLEQRIAPSSALPQPQPPGQFPSGGPSTAPGGSNDPGSSDQ